jgi:hypothetical protein
MNFYSDLIKEFDIDMSHIAAADGNRSVGEHVGMYAILSGKVVGYVACNGQLAIVLDEKTIEVDESLSVHWTAHGQFNRLEIVQGSYRFSIEYLNDRKPISTPFYTEDDEVVDFGHWLSNVLNTPERKDFLLRDAKKNHV